MKKTAKVLMLVLCAMLLVAGSVLGTLAYLQYQDNVTNTFTSGQVKIYMDEYDWDRWGDVLPEDDSDNVLDLPGAEEIDNNRDKVNEYELIPGRTVVKDPTVTVTADSEESYVYMKVSVQNLSNLTGVLTAEEWYVNDTFMLQNLVSGYEADTWKYVGFENDSYLFVYYKTVTTKDSADELELEPLFTHVTLPAAEFTNDNIGQINGVTINVSSYAVQAEGFATAESAWETVFSGDNGFVDATWPATAN